MSIEVRPLSEALGAEVRGLDLEQPIAAADVEALREAFLDSHFLCLRSEPIDAASFARLARHFGEPQLQLLREFRHDAVPEVSFLRSTYETAEDKPDDLAEVRLSGWHTDDSYFETPAKITMLQALAIPDSSGETRFCNTRKAYDDMPDETKRRLDGLKAVHAYDTARAPARAHARAGDEESETPDVTHPLVRTHEDSGRAAIYFNSNRTDRVVGMARADSDALLDAIHEHITQPRYRYDHAWQLGDVLIWDNRCLIHSVNTDYPVGQKRLHQRILLKGTRPV